MRALAPGLVLSMATAAVGCGAGGDPPVPPPSLEECMVGEWVSERACECAALPAAYQTSECLEADCHEADVLVYRADGTAFEFQARWSEAANTVSVIFGCDFLDSTWELIGTRVRQDYSGTIYDAEVVCSAGELNRGDTATFDAAPSVLAPALAALPGASDCSDYPLVPAP